MMGADRLQPPAASNAMLDPTGRPPRRLDSMVLPAHFPFVSCFLSFGSQAVAVHSLLCGGGGCHHLDVSMPRVVAHSRAVAVRHAVTALDAVLWRIVL